MVNDLGLQRWTDTFNKINGGTTEAAKPIGGLSADDLSSMLREIYPAQQSAASPQQKDQGDFVRGLKEPFQQLPQLAYGVGALAGAAGEKLFGSGGFMTALKGKGVEGYQEWSDTISSQAKETDDITTSWKRAYEGGDYGALVDWLQHGIGYALGQGVQLVATAGLGGAIAKGVGQGAVKKLASGLVRKEVARIQKTALGGALLKKGGQDLLTRAATAEVAKKIGQNAAMAATAFGMEGGEIGGDLVSTAMKEGRELTGGEIARALGATLAAGSLEFVADKAGLDILLGKSKFFKGAATAKGISGRAQRAAYGMAADIPIEAGTEFAQTQLEEYGKGKEMFTPEANQQALNAAALGGLSGGVFGGAGGMVSSPQPEAQKPKPTQPQPVTPEVMPAQDKPSNMGSIARLGLPAPQSPRLALPDPNQINLPGAFPLPSPTGYDPRGSADDQRSPNLDPAVAAALEQRGQRPETPGGTPQAPNLIFAEDYTLSTPGARRMSLQEILAETEEQEAAGPTQAKPGAMPIPGATLEEGEMGGEGGRAVAPNTVDPPGTEEYVYHTTSQENLKHIIQGGILPKIDEVSGSIVDGFHVSASEMDADKWGAVKGGVVLRFKPTGKTREGTYENTRKHFAKVNPADIEIKTENGWQPLGEIAIEQPKTWFELGRLVKDSGGSGLKITDAEISTIAKSLGITAKDARRAFDFYTYGDTELVKNHKLPKVQPAQKNDINKPPTPALPEANKPETATNKENLSVEKQPWEMTREEYVRSQVNILVGSGISENEARKEESTFADVHAREVKRQLFEQTMAKGKPVPAAVLQDYAGEDWADQAIADQKPASMSDKGNSVPSVSGKPRSDAQLANDEKLRKQRTEVSPDDDLIKAISKLGGIDYGQAQKEWGATITDAAKDMNRRGVFGKPVLRKNGGLPIDRMRELLVERGFQFETTNDLLEAMDRSARGETVLSSWADYESLAREAEQDYFSRNDVDPFDFTDTDLEEIGYTDLDKAERAAYEELYAQAVELIGQDEITDLIDTLSFRFENEADFYREATNALKGVLNEQVQGSSAEKSRESQGSRGKVDGEEAARSEKEGFGLTGQAQKTAEEFPHARAGNWWDNELTPAGRRLIMEKAGVKRPDRVLWKNLTKSEQENFWAAREAVDVEAAEGVAPAKEADPLKEMSVDDIMAVFDDEVTAREEGKKPEAKKPAEPKPKKEAEEDRIRREIETKGSTRAGNAAVSVQDGGNIGYYYRVVEGGATVEKGPGYPAKWGLGTAQEDRRPAHRPQPETACRI